VQAWVYLEVRLLPQNNYLYGYQLPPQQNYVFVATCPVEQESPSQSFNNMAQAAFALFSIALGIRQLFKP
jgi:hypothetical protein